MSKQVQYFMAGQDQTQNNQTLRKIPLADDYDQTFDKYEETQENKNEAIAESKEYKLSQDYLTDRDLGPQVFELIQCQYCKVNQEKTFDPQELFGFWKKVSRSKRSEQAKYDSAFVASFTENPKSIETTLENYAKNYHVQDEERKSIFETSEMYKRQNVKTFDPRALFEFWKFLRNRYLNSEEVHAQKLIDIANLKQTTIQYILEINSPVFKREEEKRQEEMMKKYYENLPKPQKKKLTKKTQERLYSSKKKNLTFIEELMEQYAKNYPYEETYQKSYLLDEWKSINKNKFPVLNISETQAVEEIDNYLQNWIQKALNDWKMSYGLRPENENLKGLYEKMAKRGMKLSQKDWNLACDNYQSQIQKKLDEEQQKEADEIQKQEKKRQEDAEKKVDYERLKNLAQPKDILKRGKELLRIKKMFPKDPILTKNFKENANSQNTPMNTTILIQTRRKKSKECIQHRFGMTLSDLKRPQREKQEQYLTLFSQLLEDYQQIKINQLKKFKNQKQEELKQKKYMVQAALRFIKFRKRRFNERVPTLRGFLSTLFKECQTQYKLLVHEKFRHRTYGESKELKSKTIHLESSFPVSFKRHFFSVLKQIIKSKQKKTANPKLPFWAPASGLQKCRIHVKGMDCPLDCKYKSLNIKVYELSRDLKKYKEIMKEREQWAEDCWAVNEYTLERMNVLMTFSDVKECTFKPFVNHQGKKMYDIQEWVNKLGEDFKGRFPMVLKYGVFRRAYVLFTKRQYTKSYKQLVLHFNIPSIKEVFDLNYNIQNDIFYDPKSLYYLENLNLEKDKLPQNFEQLKAKHYHQFYHDVYDLIMDLEKIDHDLRKSKREVQRLIALENVNASSMNDGYEKRKNQIKSFMCPLNDKCPDRIYERWPNNNIKSTTVIGTHCPYAHHTYELKFKQEKKIKKKMLKHVLQVLNEKREKGHFETTSFNPGGGIMRSCIGCSQKTYCAFCELRSTAQKKIEVSFLFRLFVKEVKSDIFKLLGQKILKRKPRKIKSSMIISQGKLEF